MKLTFPLALGLLFITLKLTNVIAWSWFWVLAPFWFGFAVFLFILVVTFLALVWDDYTKARSR
jgi:hypothetical protein